MIMKKSILILTTLMVMSPVQAGYFYDGNQLLELCESREGSPDAAACSGYIAGVFDMIDGYQGTLDVKSYICVPVSVKVSQLKRIVVKFLNANPKQLHLSARGEVWDALHEAFPCKSVPMGKKLDK